MQLKGSEKIPKFSTFSSSVEIVQCASSCALFSANKTLIYVKHFLEPLRREQSPEFTRPRAEKLRFIDHYIRDSMPFTHCACFDKTKNSTSSSYLGHTFHPLSIQGGKNIPSNLSVLASQTHIDVVHADKIDFGGNYRWLVISSANHNRAHVIWTTLMTHSTVWTFLFNLLFRSRKIYHKYHE